MPLSCLIEKLQNQLIESSGNMAPQQNSTLIDDNLDTCPSLMNLPEALLQRYSPILPPKNQQYQNQDKNNNNNENTNTNNKNNNNNDNDNNHIYMEGIEELCNTKQVYNQQKIKEEPQIQCDFNERQYKNKYYPSGSSHIGGQRQLQKRPQQQHSRRSRSISLHGVNSTVEQGNKEIPIWLNDEPRYVSGVTNKTTCNDIIKALIDDEILNGNMELQQCTTKHLKDGRNTASRDYSDYVITESWRGIERSYNGNMAILPVWRAWSRVHNELRLSLKHYKEIKDPLQSQQISEENKNKSFSLLKYLKKIFRFKNSKKHNKINNKTKEKCLVSGKKGIPDEFFFVILPDQLYEKECVPPKNLKSSRNEHLHSKLMKSKLYRLAETRATLRRKRSSSRRREERSRLEPAMNCIRRRKDAPMRSSLRNKLAQKNAEMNTLYEREYALTKQLSQKCKLFKLQNDLYTNPSTQMELSVGQIQRNIEAYAEEIIQTEHELLELKNEIRQDISLINNLKRLTITEAAAVHDCGVPLAMEGQTNKICEKISDDNTQVAKTEVDCNDETAKMQTKQMQFVDNIYEFCDNNASMLV